MDGGRETTSHRRHHHGRRRGLAPCSGCGRLIDRRWRRCPLCGTSGAFSLGERKLVTALVVLAVPLSLVALAYLLLLSLQR